MDNKEILARLKLIKNGGKKEEKEEKKAVKLPKIIKKSDNPKKRQRRNSDKDVPIEIWEEIKKLHMLSELPYKRLANEFKNHGVTTGMIERRAFKEKWDEERTRHWERAKNNVRDEVVKWFTSANLPPKKLIRLIAEGALRTTKLQDVKEIIVPKEGERAFKPYNLVNTFEFVDNSAVMGYRKLAVELLDLHPAPKASISFDGVDNKDKAPTLNIRFNQVESRRKSRPDAKIPKNLKVKK